MKKLFQKVLEIIKHNLLFLILFFISLFLFTFELPYYIKTTGGVIDISSRLNLNDSSKIHGKYYMAYVSELKATIPTYLIAKVNKKWDITPKEKEVSSNESEEDALFRNKILLEESILNATQVAYQKASKKFQVSDIKNYVVYVNPTSKTDLKVGDIILKVNGEKIESKEDIQKMTSTLKEKDKIEIEVLHDHKNYTRIVEMINYQEKTIMGVVISENYKIDSEFSFSFQKTESGSSGGLMMALTLYDLLSNKDLAKGRKIAGTGTIDKYGNVGEIDGVSYKLGGAVKEGATIFFVPIGENYEEAIKTQDKFDYDIEIVGVKNIDDAIHYLEEEINRN